jgi:dTDP-4-amino-4,6-dideoxygalactose transaminase
MYEVSWWKTSIGEAEIHKLSESVSHGNISLGPVTAQFEAEFAAALEVPYAVATTSGSVALLMALMALGVGRDDEVILPNRTFIAPAHAVLLLGAKVVLVDVLPDIPIMDVSQVKQKITPRTKAIIPVHLNGRATDMAAIHDVAREYDLRVVEDSCQALFSKNAFGYLGTQADVGCFSLGMAKLISTGQGGVAVTKSRGIYEKLRLIRGHGVPDVFAANFEEMGFNFRITDLLASIGLVQLTRAGKRINHVRSIYEKYTSAMEHLPFIELIPVKVSSGEVPLYVEVLCRDRGELIEFLDSQGVQTRPFLPDLHLSPHLNNNGDFKNSRHFSEQGLTLPCGPEQPLENVDRVIEALHLYWKCRPDYLARQWAPNMLQLD